MPLVGIRQPCGEPSAQLPDNHKKAVNHRLRHGFFGVHSIPTLIGGGFVAGSDILGGFYAESISDEHKQVRHHERLPHKAHEQTAQPEHKERIGLGTNVAQHKEDGKAHEQHHLFAADAHQLIEERRKSRHAYRGAKAGKHDVFRLDAQPAYHFAAIGGIHAAHRYHRHKEHNHKDDADGFGHPFKKRIVAIIFCHGYFRLSVFSAFTTTIIPAAKRLLSSALRLEKSILTGTRC